MSNTLIIDSLNTLFSMSNTAVIGAQEQFVAFMNPAAQELFRGNRTNHKLTELLPAHITEATATEFVTSATIEKRHVIISVTSFGAFRLFSFVPQGETPCGPARSLHRFWHRSTLSARSRRIFQTTPCSSATCASGATPPN